MATKDKIVEIVMAIKTIYPYYAKDTNVDLLVRTWGMLLYSYDDKTVENAFWRCMQRCKVPPTPAEVIEQIQAVQKMDAVPPEALWSIYCSTLRDAVRLINEFGYTYVDETGMSQGQQARMKFSRLWAGLPDEIKSYLSAEGELMRVAQESNSNSDFLTYEKQRFTKSVREQQSKQEYAALPSARSVAALKHTYRGD